MTRKEIHERVLIKAPPEKVFAALLDSLPGVGDLFPVGRFLVVAGQGGRGFVPKRFFASPGEERAWARRLAKRCGSSRPPTTRARWSSTPKAGRIPAATM